MNNESAIPSNDLSAVDSLVLLTYLIHSTLSRACADHDLSFIQLRLFGILRDREPAMLQLARHLGLDKSSITGLIDRAERRGLVERIKSPNDRRGFHVRLTPAGRELAQEVGGEIEREIQAVLEALDETEQSQLTALAAKILGVSIFPK